MIIGTRLTAKTMRDELEDAIDKSELIQKLKKLLDDQTLTTKATKFFEEATTLVTSTEAKNFFRNTSTLMKQYTRTETPPLPPPKKNNP